MNKLTSTFFILIFVFFSVSNINAATYTVSNTNDNGAGSLRQVILQANMAEEADVIVFDPQVFNTPKTITLTGGQIAPGYPLVIEGPGANLLTISGNNQSRIFYKNSPFGNDLTIKNLTLTKGFATNGGAIYSSGAALELSNVVITDNTVMGREENPGIGIYAGFGGGIYSSGSLTITDSVISNNLASGVVAPSFNPTFAGGAAAGGGGGIFSSSFEATIINCTFINNVAKGANSPNGGNGQSGGSGGEAYGGAIYGRFILYVINSNFINNSAVAGNGGSIVEPQGQTAGRGGQALGGAIFSSGTRILNSTFNNNSAIGGTAGGGPFSYNAVVGGIASGGGIYDDSLNMANATVVNNTVTAGNGRIGGDGSAGGVYVSNSSQWKVVNSTITGNTVTGGAGTESNGLSQGGGMFSKPETNQTLFYNNIVAENSAAVGVDVFGVFSKTGNNLIRVGGGATGINDGENGNMVGNAASPLDPKLASLTDNGGLTETRALLAGSPAINAGNNSRAINPITFQTLQFDQRNFQRIVPGGGTIDIGAFELGASIIPATGSPDLQKASDTGLSDTDNITKSTMPVFDVSDTIPGAKVELLRNNVVVSSVIATSFLVSLKDLNPPLDGVVQYTSQQTINEVVSAVSSSLTVTFDHTPPQVTVSQHTEQTDPTTALPIRFTVSISEPAFLNREKISLTSSTADVSNAFIIVNAVNSSTYTVEVHNIGSPGKIILTMFAQAVYDYVFNYSDDPIYTDNSVTFQPNTALVSVSGRVRKSSGIIRTSSIVTLTDTFTGETWQSRTNSFGYYNFVGLKIYQQIGRRFTVRIDNKSFTYNIFQSITISGNRENLNFIVP